MAQFIVREYKLDDRDAVEKCSLELQEDEYTREPHYWGKPEAIVSSYIDYVLKSVDTSGGKIFVTEVDGIVVGFAVMIISEKEDSPAVSLERFGYVMDLVVLREYKGRGFGKALMEKAEEFIKSKGLEWMQIDVTFSNSALDFYKKIGYKEKSIRLEKRL